MKRFFLSLLALFCVASCAQPQCVGRRGLLPASTFSVPQYSCYGCSGCYGSAPQQVPIPAPVPQCSTCQAPEQPYLPQQYAPQYDTAPSCAPQQQLAYAPQQQLSYAPQASFAASYAVQRSFVPSYGVGAAFAPGYAVAPIVAPIFVRGRFFAPRFLGPPIHRFPRPRPHALGFGLGLSRGFAPGLIGGGGGFFFRGRGFSFGRF